MMDEVTIFTKFTDSAYLPDYLRSLRNQTYNKNRLHLFLDVSQLHTQDQTLVHEFSYQDKHNYDSVFINCRSITNLGLSAVNYSRHHRTNYFFIEQNVILHPRTLQRLHALGLDVVSPMLIADGVYSNFHAEVDENGYYKPSDRYFQILNRDAKGIHDVPVVNGCYLIRCDRVKYVTYDDGSGRLEYVIFSDVMRKCLVPQYIDNTFNYGLMVNYADKIIDKLVELDAFNNKEFYLNIDKQRKKRSYVTRSGFQLM